MGLLDVLVFVAIVVLVLDLFARPRKAGWPTYQRWSVLVIASAIFLVTLLIVGVARA